MNTCQPHNLEEEDLLLGSVLAAMTSKRRGAARIKLSARPARRSDSIDLFLKAQERINH